MCDDWYSETGQVCRIDSESASNSLSLAEGDRYTLSLPARTDHDAIAFLQGLGGDASGAGRAMRRIGIDAPVVRSSYKRQVEKLTQQIAERLRLGHSVDDTARWASEQRRQIVAQMRSSSSPSARWLYEIRDWRKYGRGGRTFENMSRRYRSQGVPQSKISGRILDGAQRSNTGVNAAVRGASFLRHGGRVLIVVGVSISAARIWNASDEEMPRVIGEELGGFVGGSVGAGAGVGICLVFGLASGGLGLLACGVVGGLTGGIAGSALGGKVSDAVYYSDATAADDISGEVVIEIPASKIYTLPPARMCVAPSSCASTEP